jgi:hypothetical protein
MAKRPAALLAVWDEHLQAESTLGHDLRGQIGGLWSWLKLMQDNLKNVSVKDREKTERLIRQHEELQNRFLDIRKATQNVRNLPGKSEEFFAKAEKWADEAHKHLKVLIANSDFKDDPNTQFIFSGQTLREKIKAVQAYRRFALHPAQQLRKRLNSRR